MSRTHFSQKRLSGLLVIAVMFLHGYARVEASLLPLLSKATEQGKKKGKGGKGGKKSDKSAKRMSKAPTKVGMPAMWNDPGDISSLDLFWGIGGLDLAPKAPFTFDKEDMTGTNPKIKVIDAAGIKWNIKFDEEVHSEVAASRIVWACGYMVEESYFLPSGKVQGVQGLTRARQFIGPDGSFSSGMFEKRPDTITRRQTPWAWDFNPFVGTKELSGLAILNTMLNNWDAKTENNNVLAMYDDDGVTVKEWHLVTDWGGTFGKMGGSISFSKTKWDLEDFRKQGFIEGVSSGSLKLHYSGKMRSYLKTVPLGHARWFAGVIGQLTDEQLRAAIKAAGGNEMEVLGFSARLREKINELKSAVGESASR